MYLFHSLLRDKHVLKVSISTEHVFRIVVKQRHLRTRCRSASASGSRCCYHRGRLSRVNCMRNLGFVQTAISEVTAHDQREACVMVKATQRLRFLLADRLRFLDDNVYWC